MHIETLVHIIATAATSTALRKGSTETQLAVHEIYAGLLEVPETDLMQVLGQVLVGAAPSVAMAFCKSAVNRAVWQIFTQEQARKRAIAKGQDPDGEYPGNDQKPQIPTESVEELHAMLDIAYQGAFREAFNWLPDTEPLPWGMRQKDEKWENANCISQALLWVEEQAEQREKDKKAEAQKSRAAVADVFAKYRAKA